MHWTASNYFSFLQYATLEEKLKVKMKKAATDISYSEIHPRVTDDLKKKRDLVLLIGYWLDFEKKIE